MNGSSVLLAVIARRSVYIVRINAAHAPQMPFKIMQMGDAPRGPLKKPGTRAGN